MHINFDTWINSLHITMFLREPCKGLTRKLVLAFDVGTTFSGVSYCVLSPGDVPVIRGVARSVASSNTMSLAHGAIADILRKRVSEVTPKYHQIYITTFRDTSALWILHQVWYYSWQGSKVRYSNRATEIGRVRPHSKFRMPSSRHSFLLHSQDVADLFEPSIEAIIEAFEQQRRAASTPINVSIIFHSCTRRIITSPWRWFAWLAVLPLATGCLRDSRNIFYL